MAYCQSRSVVKSTPTTATVISLRCRSWHCIDCADVRKRQLMAEAIAGRPNKFLTLTSRKREDKTPEQAAKELSYAWRIVRLRLMRRYKLRSLPFLAVFERHASGWPHLHILLRAPWLDQRTISKWMAELCDGPNVWIEHLYSSKKASVYCAKYSAKCAEKIGTSKRYWQSVDYDLREDQPEKHSAKPGEGWEQWDKTIRFLANCFETWGYDVEWQGMLKFHANLTRDGPS